MGSIIKSFSVGDGDMYYIRHGNSNFSIIDCCLKEDRKEKIVDELIEKSRGKDIVRFISTHPDDDHIHGLEYLDQRMELLNFYCVSNQAIKEDETDSFNRYCQLRDSSKAYFLSKGCSRCWMNKNDNVKKYGCAGINILWPELSNDDFIAELVKANKGLSFNNLSPIITYSLNGGVKAIWMGDLETSFMEKIEDEVVLDNVDILFAPHHGRSSGKPPKSWLDAMDPSLIVIGEADSKHLNYYDGYTHICQNTAGDLLFECDDGVVHIYAENPYDANGLLDLGKGVKDGLGYMGSIETK